MLETATTGEMQSHYARAHAARAEAFRAVVAVLTGLLSVKMKGPRLAARPLDACA
ncbi:hypothetical protein [Marimonas lutisalis]|uniref:hypothetical protein n=1 Tax=Marimonas lutisalis TaxID=2545756 RepID=UPI001375AAC9|nr:hypothetical protein [Marimonas lutisalis]